MLGDDDDGWGRRGFGVYPTLINREGPDVGRAQENNMARGVTWPNGCQTVEFQNHDGSITTYRTHGGMPQVTTNEIASVTTVVPPRGFVAKVPSGQAVLFNPYTLDILEAAYSPSGKIYSVQDFATSWNVHAGDTTHWHDVVCIDGTVKVNASSMYTLGSFGALSTKAIPHIINRGIALDQYGDAALNSTEKRYFEVNRETVKSWGGSGVTETLLPVAPRSGDPSQAMTIGARVDFSAEDAHVGQLFFGTYAPWSDDGITWDDSLVTWMFSSAQVYLSLTAPYLDATHSLFAVDRPAPSPTYLGVTAESTDSGETLPSTEICMVGIGELGSSNFGDALYTQRQRVVFPPRTTFSYSIPGIKTLSGTVQSWLSTATGAGMVAGRAYTSSVSNSFVRKAMHETKRFNTLDVPTFTSLGGGTAMGVSGNMAQYGTSYTWFSTGAANATPRDDTGTGTIRVIGGAFSTSADNDRRIQTCSANIDVDGIVLLSLSMSREKFSGTQVSVSPMTGRFATMLAAPYSNLGIHSIFDVGMNCDYPFTVVGMRQPLILSKASDYVGGLYYQGTPGTPTYLFSTTTTPVADVDDQALLWSTKDFILFDDANGVYISVEGEFIGEQGYGSAGTATLTITLKVQTRHHTTVQTLQTYTLSYSNLVPQTQTLTTGVLCAPTPLTRLMFCPLHQNQGDFKGGHYVTLAEETAGAVPFHGFNFYLRLVTYDGVGSVNALNADEEVAFIPCNLLEMLYAFVFSQGFGVSALRYPVTRTSDYNAIINTLFVNRYRVAVRNGTAGNWTDTFGADFAATQTVSLHRT